MNPPFLSTKHTKATPLFTHHSFRAFRGPLHAVPSINPMPEPMGQCHRTIRPIFLNRLPLGRRVDRDQPQLKSKPDHQKTGPEIALYQHIVALFGLRFQPCLDRLQICVDLAQLRRYPLPHGFEIRGETYQPLNSQRPARLLFLEGSDLVVEYQKECSDVFLLWSKALYLHLFYHS